MKKHIKFPSIGQYRNIVKEVVDRVCYIGKDEEGNALFDYTLDKPIIPFYGTVKLHGTNGAVCYNRIDGLWVQSRERIISIGSDNMGCAFGVQQREEAWMKIINELAVHHNINLTENNITIFFAWAGKSIQKNVAISELPKSAYIFPRFRVTSMNEEDTQEKWYSTGTSGGQRFFNSSDCHRDIYNVCDFKQFKIEIDFNSPDEALSKLEELTLQVEDECPIAKALGVSGIGEGIVWEALYGGKRLAFKTKGDRHSSKGGVKLDKDLSTKVGECVSKIAHIWRFEQAISEVYKDEIFDHKKIGLYINWVIEDTVKEESDIITECGFIPEDIKGGLSKVAKKYLFTRFNI